MKHRSHWRKKRVWITLGILVFFLIIAIGDFNWYSPQPMKSPSKKVEKDKITIGFAKESLNSLALIALQQGYFADEGLEVVAKEYPSGKIALLEGLLKGEVDITAAAETPIVFNSLKQNSVKIIASIGSSENEARIIARKDRNIQSPEDLRGKNIATQRASAVHFFLHMFLTKHLIADNEVNISYLKANDLPKALAEGTIDAFSMREPFISRAEELLPEKTIIFTTPGLYTKSFNLISLDHFINKRPETIDRVLKALLRAEALVLKKPELAMQIIATNLAVSKESVKQLWPQLKLRVSLEQWLLLSLEEEARWIVESGFSQQKNIPNYLESLYLQGLKQIKPEKITIIH